MNTGREGSHTDSPPPQPPPPPSPDDSTPRAHAHPWSQVPKRHKTDPPITLSRHCTHQPNEHGPALTHHHSRHRRRRHRSLLPRRRLHRHRLRHRLRASVDSSGPLIGGSKAGSNKDVPPPSAAPPSSPPPPERKRQTKQKEAERSQQQHAAEAEYGPSPPQPPPSPAAIPPWYPQAAPQPATQRKEGDVKQHCTSWQRGKLGSPAMMIMQPLPQLEATLRPRTAHERTHASTQQHAASGP